MSDLQDYSSATVLGAVVGNVAVPGIKAGDRIVLVQPLMTNAVPPVPIAAINRAAEFKALTDGNINNAWVGAGGATTAAMYLLVTYERTGRNRTRTGRSNY
jgi:hypothetical protein